MGSQIFCALIDWKGAGVGRALGVLSVCPVPVVKAAFERLPLLVTLFVIFSAQYLFLRCDALAFGAVWGRDEGQT